MERTPVVELTWTDPVTGTRAYLVLDQLIRGLASGGLRVRGGCTMDEARGLARAMSLKETLVYNPADHYVPLGGAKGAVDLDPDDPRKPDVLRRFLRDVRPTAHAQWCFGEDFGVRQELLDAVAADVDLPSTIEPLLATLDDPASARQRMKDAFGADVDGVPLDELVGGYGVAVATEAYLASQGRGLTGTSAVVQGFGSIGGAAARYLARSGARVVAVADRDGLIVDESGLDVERLLQARDGGGRIDRALDGVTLCPGAEWLDVPCDVLVPAAVSYVIDRADADRVRAGVVVEGANMPTLPDAEAALGARGVAVLPDFLANVATNAWWYWLVFGDIGPQPDEGFAKIATVMRRLVGTVAEDADGGSLRDAARALADRNAAALTERFG
ncbi:MAG: glutamate dehydrogenase [Streptosporangiales bacterium]|nr:glutamate dehydrogenase [Streptosporangiales bacterium]